MKGGRLGGERGGFGVFGGTLFGGLVVHVDRNSRSQDGFGSSGRFAD